MHPKEKDILEKEEKMFLYKKLLLCMFLQKEKNQKNRNSPGE